MKLDNVSNLDMSIDWKVKHTIEPEYLMYCSHEDCIETSCDSFSSIERFCAHLETHEDELMERTAAAKVIQASFRKVRGLPEPV